MQHKHGSPIEIDIKATPPADLKQCALLIAGHWWENRENAVSDTLSDIPLDADEILLNHRGWAF